MGVCNCSLFCCTLLYVHSSIAIILKGKRELVAMLNLSSWCLVMVERLFLVVPRGCLLFVIVVFSDHTHLLFLYQFLTAREKLLPIGHVFHTNISHFVKNAYEVKFYVAHMRILHIDKIPPSLPHFAFDFNS